MSIKKRIVHFLGMVDSQGKSRANQSSFLQYYFDGGFV